MNHEWDPAPPTPKQKVIAGLLLALIAITSANLYFEWHLFGEYGKAADVITVVAMILALAFWMPGIRRT